MRFFSGAEGSALYDLTGDARFDNYSYAVSGAGDLNGDGFDDFIVGAIFGGQNNGGYARVYVSQVISGLTSAALVGAASIAAWLYWPGRRR